MNQHGHSHSDHKNHNHPPTGMKKHSKWLVLAVVLMLVGMAIYVMSDDEALVPAGDGPGEVVPAAP